MILIVLVVWLFVKLVNMFLGIKDKICCGIDKFLIVFWCVVNLEICVVFVVFCVNLVFWRLNSIVELILINVVIVVVLSKEVSIVVLIFFSFLEIFIFVNVLMIEMNIRGIISICKNDIYFCFMILIYFIDWVMILFFILKINWSRLLKMILIFNVVKMCVENFVWCFCIW